MNTLVAIKTSFIMLYNYRTKERVKNREPKAKISKFGNKNEI